jgi:hypothetical protein
MLCNVGELRFDRPLDAGGAREVLEGILGYHFVYKYEGGKFVGLRAFAHEGLGAGNFFSVEECGKMWREAGLCQDLEPELLKATGGVEEEIKGARLLRGEEHKLLDVEKASGRRAAREEKKASRERESEAEMSAAMAATGLHFCPACARPFQRKSAFDAHVEKCAAELQRKREQSQFAKLRPVSELEGSMVQSSQLLLFQGGSGDEGHACVLSFAFARASTRL